MAFSNEKVPPKNEADLFASPIVFKTVRSSVMQTSRRKRQCYRCMHNIEKNQTYVNHQFKYDKRIISISFHENCF